MALQRWWKVNKEKEERSEQNTFWQTEKESYAFVFCTDLQILDPQQQQDQQAASCTIYFYYFFFWPKQNVDFFSSQE